ncbi:molybdopterin-containing oxidoreductase family protein [Natranaerobius trueperi]|nr:molybdopterin-dependent oxidoreductase [Natranaerobius trueperi]
MDEKVAVNRRTFIKTAVGTGLAMGTGLKVPNFVKAKSKEQNALYEKGAKEVPTVCGVCSGGCAAKAYVKNDRVKQLVGNPKDQAAGGKLCVKGYNSIETLYDPDRVKYPMKRTNPDKGIGVDPKFVKISWDEALDHIANKLNTIVDEYGPEALMFIMRSNPFSSRLGKAIGTPNFISHQSTCFTTQEVMWRSMVTGGGKPWTYDLENSNYILSFGCDLLGKAKNMHLRNTASALENGAKLVVLDPRKSTTASRAHEWIPIKPGTDLAFALAMIKVIVEEDLYDKDFVNKYTEGIDEIKEFVKDYTPEWAEKITEIPKDTIVKIAREFSNNKPAFIPSHKRDAAGPNYSNSSRLAQAQIILNALVGSIDRKGGAILSRNPGFPGFDEVFPSPEFPQPKTQRIDGFEQHPIISEMYRGDFATLAEGILTENPYPVKAALLRGYTTLSFPNAKRMTKALTKLDFLVTFEILPSEAVQLSDIVLPEPHWLESSGFSDRGYHCLHPQVAVRLPASERLHDTRGFSSIITDLAKRMGYGEYFEGVSGEKWNDKQLKGIGTSWEELSNDPDGLWSKQLPFEPTTEFDTPSGKIELYSTVLKENGYDPLPYWKAKREEPSEEYPFYFIISRPSVHKMHSTQNNPIANEISPENHAVMNSKTALELGINDGDEVIVESKVSQIKVNAKLIEGIRPDCVMVKHGFGRWSKELSVAHSKGANEGDLIPDMTVDEMRNINDPGAGACMSDFCVKVFKA